MGNKKRVYYNISCPFCGKQHKQQVYINTICDCGAKFYYNTCIWLDRKKSNKKFYTLYDLVFDEEEENE